MELTAVSKVGGRDHQEDNYIAILVPVTSTLSLTVIGVMDGHGGYETSDYIAKNFLQILMHVGYDPNKINWMDALKITMVLIGQMTERYASGSTASIVLVPSNESRAYVAVIGDSPVIILDSQGKTNVSPEHNARSNQIEREAAVSRGAIYSGGYLYSSTNGDGLQMSRAFGDVMLATFIDRTPDFYEVPLCHDSFILVGSDGLFDPGHETTGAQITYLIDMLKNDATAEDLVNDAINRRTGDNVTAVVARYE